MEKQNYRQKFFHSNGEKVDLWSDDGVVLLSRLTPSELWEFRVHCRRYIHLRVFPDLWYDDSVGTLTIRFNTNRKLKHNHTLTMYLREPNQVHLDTDTVVPCSTDNSITQSGNDIPSESL